MEEPLDRKTVALLIDYDNLQLCAQRDAPGVPLDLHSVVAFAQRYGSVVVARAYAEWNSPAERLAAYKAGIEPAFAPVLRTEGPSSDGKSLADTVIVAEGVDLVWSYAPDTFVLVTSDKDLIPLARLVKQRGAKIVILGSDLTAVPLREMADDFITYRRLVQEVTGVLVGPGPGPRGQPRSRPAPRVERRSPEPSAAAAAVSPRQPREAAAMATEQQPSTTPSTTVAASPGEEGEDAPTPTGDQAAEDAQGVGVLRRRRRRGGRGRGRGDFRRGEEGAEGAEFQATPDGYPPGEAGASDPSERAPTEGTPTPFVAQLASTDAPAWVADQPHDDDGAPSAEEAPPPRRRSPVRRAPRRATQTDPTE